MTIYSVLRIAGIALPLLLAAAARAETEGNGEGAGVLGNMDPTVKTECSACHNAYPAQFLPKESWTLIMDNLSDHFGEDATLPPDTLATVKAYLLANAAPSDGSFDPAKPPLRITELPWYTQEHGHRLRARAKADPSIGTLSNCAGCHQGF